MGRSWSRGSWAGLGEIGPLEVSYTIFEWDGFHWVFRRHEREGAIVL